MLGVQAGMDLPALLPWLGGTLLFALILFLIGVLRFSRVSPEPWGYNAKSIPIAANDLRQLVREKMTFIFFLIMPILLTLLLGFALKSPQNQDLRQPITVISEERAPPHPRLDSGA